MSVRACLASTVLGTALMTAPNGVFSQQSEPVRVDSGFNDPDFWRIVREGPDNSEELEKIVTTYVANDRDDAAVRHFVDYLLREPGAADPYCNYCQSLMPAAHRFVASRPLNDLLDSTDIIFDHAFETRSTTGLMRLAVIMAWSDVREHRDRALYFLTAAAQVGIEDRWRDEVVQTLATLGFHDDALIVAKSIHDDARSEHYRSEEIKPWIDYLTLEVERRKTIGPYIATAALPK